MPIKEPYATIKKSCKVVEVQINTVQVQFPMKCDSVHWAKSGSGTLHLTASGLIKNAKCEFAYAHNVIGLTPSVTVPGGLGFQFKSAEDVFRPAAIVYNATPKTI